MAKIKEKGNVPSVALKDESWELWVVTWDDQETTEFVNRKKVV
jgi:hypothetical protein